MGQLYYLSQIHCSSLIIGVYDHTKDMRWLNLRDKAFLRGSSTILFVEYAKMFFSLVYIYSLTFAAKVIESS